jgi:hypothetical protein
MLTLFFGLLFSLTMAYHQLPLPPVSYPAPGHKPT